MVDFSKMNVSKETEVRKSYNKPVMKVLSIGYGLMVDPPHFGDGSASGEAGAKGNAIFDDSEGDGQSYGSEIWVNAYNPWDVE